MLRLGNEHRSFTFEETLQYYGQFFQGDRMLNIGDSTQAYKDGNLDELFRHETPEKSIRYAIFSLNLEVDDISTLLNEKKSIESTLKRIEAIIDWLRKKSII